MKKVKLIIGKDEINLYKTLKASAPFDMVSAQKSIEAQAYEVLAVSALNIVCEELSESNGEVNQFIITTLLVCKYCCDKFTEIDNSLSSRKSTNFVFRKTHIRSIDLKRIVDNIIQEFEKGHDTKDEDSNDNDNDNEHFCLQELLNNMMGNSKT